MGLLFSPEWWCSKLLLRWAFLLKICADETKFNNLEPQYCKSKDGEGIRIISRSGRVFSYNTGSRATYRNPTLWGKMWASPTLPSQRTSLWSDSSELWLDYPQYIGKNYNHTWEVHKTGQTTLTQVFICFCVPPPTISPSSGGWETQSSASQLGGGALRKITRWAAGEHWVWGTEVLSRSQPSGVAILPRTLSWSEWTLFTKGDGDSFAPTFLSDTHLWKKQPSWW